MSVFERVRVQKVAVFERVRVREEESIYTKTDARKKVFECTCVSLFPLVCVRLSMCVRMSVAARVRMSFYTCVIAYVKEFNVSI